MCGNYAQPTSASFLNNKLVSNFDLKQAYYRSSLTSHNNKFLYTLMTKGWIEYKTDGSLTLHIPIKMFWMRYGKPDHEIIKKILALGVQSLCVQSLIFTLGMA